MKIIVEHHHVRSTDALDSMIEDRIFALQPRLQIDEANIRIECHTETSPAFRVRIHLVTPGPDLVAEGSDHTPRAALAKVLNELRDTLDHRQHSRHRRRRGNLQQPTERRRQRSRR